MQILLAAVFSVLIFAPSPEAARLHHEKVYQDAWCAERGGQTEVRLENGTRVDCLTDTHAIEFDFGDKWAECIGQSRLYSNITGKDPGCVLILENEGEERFLRRLYDAILGDVKPWRVWTMGPGNLPTE